MEVESHEKYDDETTLNQYQPIIMLKKKDLKTVHQCHTMSLSENAN